MTDLDSLPRPVVTVEPGKRSGRPHIRGISVDALVDPLVAGESPESVCDEYSVTRDELLVACWFAARHDTGRIVLSKQWRAWRAWLDRHEQTLWRGGYDPAEVPLPTEEETR